MKTAGACYKLTSNYSMLAGTIFWPGGMEIATSLGKSAVAAGKI
jgi:hypothetical protein